MDDKIFIPGVINDILANMFENKKSANVFFQVGNDGREIPAHREVLSEASEGFRVRLEGPWAGVTKIAEMIGVEENVFRPLLIFIYRGGEIDVGATHLLDVLKLARSFLMQDMVDKITNQEAFNVHARRHVWSFLSFAIIAGDEELQNRCLTLIDSDANRFLSLRGFHSVESSVLKLLVGRNTLGIREVDLFNFLVSWSASSCERQGLARAAEQQRNLMQDFLFDIRYSLMSLEDVSQVVATNILTLDEIKIIRTTITMDRISIPVPSPAQSSVFLSMLPIKYGVTLSWLLLLLVILLSVMLSTRIASGSSGSKTNTPSALDQKEKELEEAMAKIDQKEKQLKKAMENIDQMEEVMNRLDQELAKQKDETDKQEKATGNRNDLKKKVKDLVAENEKLVEKVISIIPPGIEFILKKGILGWMESSFCHSCDQTQSHI